jgi:hypothetical protein
MLNISELIETLTPTDLAEALGVSVQAISNMKARGAIPPGHWPAVVELARKSPALSKQITFERLVEIHRAKPAARQRESSASIHQKRAGAV